MNRKYLSTTVRESNLLSNDELWDIDNWCNFFHDQDECEDAYQDSAPSEENTTHGNVQLLEYTICMSDLRYLGKKQYDDLISDNFVFGAGTQESKSPFIQATFDKKSIIHRIEIAPPASDMNHEQWFLNEINGSTVEYLQQIQNVETWKHLADVDGLKFGVISEMECDIPWETRAIRLKFDVDQPKCLGIGCLIVYGTQI